MSNDLTFGPPSDQWTYNRQTRTYDLTRSSPSKTAGKTYTISTSHSPPDTKIAISPDLTALVVIDMQNFFLSPKCRDNPSGLAAVEPTIKVLKQCHDLGIQVIWLNWGLTDSDLSTMPAGISRAFARSAIDSALTPGPTRPGLGSDMGSGMGRCLMSGSWNAEIYEPLAEHVHSSDIHCSKNRMSGLWSSSLPLWKFLVSSGKRTLFFAGVNTDQCVLGTISDAYSNGWDCIMVDDCCGTGTPGGREVCLHNAAGCYGFVTNSGAFANGSLA